MRHVTTPKRFMYVSVSMDSTEMGLGVLVSITKYEAIPTKRSTELWEKDLSFYWRNFFQETPFNHCEE